MYMVVFLMRYWDLFLYFVSLYNSTMKLIYLCSTAYTIHLIMYKKPYCLVLYFNLSLMIKQMTHLIIISLFIHVILFKLVVAVITLLFHSNNTIFDFSWSYSIWLEALAIYP